MVTSLALAVLLLSPAAPQDPVLHEDRVLLRTTKGDIVLVLYPRVAPAHVTHFLRLVRAGFYEGTRFIRIFPGFIIQQGGDTGRLRPLTEVQTELNEVRLPAEFGPLHHRRGVLSMSREPEDYHSARTSFNILLGDAPQLDGKYTIFGRVETGFDVLDAMAKVEIGPDYAPKTVMNLHHCWVVGEEPGSLDWLLYVGGGSIVLGLAAFLLAGRVLPKFAGPIGLSIVFAGFFVGFIAAAPKARAADSNLVPLAVFVSLLALFKLMNKFESPRP